MGRLAQGIPLYAILSGFSLGDTPGVGTFYDFCSRLWDSDSKHLSPQLRFSKSKPKKGDEKGDKTPFNTETLSARLLHFLQRFSITPNHAFALIFRLYQEQFLNTSIHAGLIDPQHLALAGDGTPIKTASYLRKRRACDCQKNGITSCKCKRKFSQPDTNTGWDSSREAYFNGYHLFIFVASDSANDLPIFTMLERTMVITNIRILLPLILMVSRAVSWVYL